jgi:sugar lactone lactonase YvrE
MKGLTAAVLLPLAIAGVAFADDNNPLHASVSTLITTPLAIEGLTNDDQGNLYAAGRAAAVADPCPVYRTSIDNPSLTIVGQIPAGGTAACSPSGLQFGPDGMLYVTQTDRIYRLKPDATVKPTADLFATGVPGTNGLAFDWNGNLWTGDGTTGVGRVWRISPDGKTVTEMFRIPSMINEVPTPAAGTGSVGVGRDVRSVPPAGVTITPTSRNANNTLGSQPLVANGVQFFNHRLYMVDTARGAVWRVKVNSDSSVSPHLGCDVTYPANTLCMDHVAVAHPLLEGADGFVIDESGGLWIDANERNAIVYVRNDGSVTEVFRNPVNPATKLRNEGPLETPTSPILFGHKLCTSNSDGNRRDNFPSSAGEIGGAGQPKGKISCIDQRVNVPGLQLPVH